MKGWVTNIQRYSVNDGYGIRTIVFLGGCTMRCAWCQNPETIAAGQASLMLSRDVCAGCGACVEECPTGAACVRDGGLAFDRDLCESCFKCVNVCYFGARKPSAEVRDVDEVFREVMKDEAFYRNSGGGLTMSGGEPLMQADFSRELLRRVKAENLHTAVETAGHVPYSAFEKILPHTDLFLFDVKLADKARHREMTGVTNSTILANLARVADTGVETIVRVPLIPGVNDGAEFDAIVDYASSLAALRELHILPYHDLGLSKYAQLDMPYLVGDLPEDNTAEVERCRLLAESRGFRVSVGGHGFAKRSAEKNEACGTCGGA